MLVARNRTFRTMILCRGVIYHVPNTLKFAERNVKEEQKRQQELVPNTLKFAERNVINHAPTKNHNLPESSYFALWKRTCYTKIATHKRQRLGHNEPQKPPIGIASPHQKNKNRRFCSEKQAILRTKTACFELRKNR